MTIPGLENSAVSGRTNLNSRLTRPAGFSTALALGLQAGKGWTTTLRDFADPANIDQRRERARAFKDWDPFGIAVTTGGTALLPRIINHNYLYSSTYERSGRGGAIGEGIGLALGSCIGIYASSRFNLGPGKSLGLTLAAAALGGRFLGAFGSLYD